MTRTSTSTTTRGGRLVGRMTAMRVPLLTGLRVVDRGGTSGRLAARLLTELGAEITDAPLDAVDVVIVNEAPSALLRVKTLLNRRSTVSALRDRHHEGHEDHEVQTRNLPGLNPANFIAKGFCSDR